MRKIGWISMSASVALALLAGCNWQTGSTKKKDPDFHKEDTGGDDQPIVIAGGSLHVFTPLGWEFNPGASNAYPWTLWDSYNTVPVTGRYVSYVEGVDTDGTAFPTAGPYARADKVTVAIQYCESRACNSGHVRGISFIYDGTLATPVLTVDDDMDHGGAFKKAFKSYLKHYTQKKYSFNQIVVKKNDTADKTWACSNDGDCEIKIHFHI